MDNSTIENLSYGIAGCLCTLLATLTGYSVLFAGDSGSGDDSSANESSAGPERNERTGQTEISPSQEQDAAATTTDSSDPEAADPSSSQPTGSIFTTKEQLYGRFVAVIWSDFATVGSAATNQLVTERLETNRQRFGPETLAVDSNNFRSVRNGTVAVVFDGGFNSAGDAKRWCRSVGFGGVQDCFGVVLSDEHSHEDRGEYIRVYDLQ